MSEERVELMEILNGIKREQEQARPRCHHCANRTAPSPSSSSGGGAGAGGGGGGGKVTTL